MSTVLVLRIVVHLLFFEFSLLFSSTKDHRFTIAVPIAIKLVLSTVCQYWFDYRILFSGIWWMCCWEEVFNFQFDCHLLNNLSCAFYVHKKNKITKSIDWSSAFIDTYVWTVKQFIKTFKMENLSQILNESNRKICHA